MKNYRFALCLALVTSCLLIELAAFGNEVMLVYKGRSFTAETWLKSCPAIAKDYVNKTSVLSLSIANKYSCRTKAVASTAASPWQLFISESRGLKFSLRYRGKELGMVSLPDRSKIKAYLADSRLLKLISYFLIDQAPYHFVVNEIDKKLQISTHEDYAAQDIIIFNHHFDTNNQRHVVTQVGLYKMDVTKESSPEGSSYTLVNSSKIDHLRAPLFGIGSGGRSRHVGDIAKRIKNHLLSTYGDGDFATNITRGLFENSFANGSIGIRYGKSLTKDNDLLEKADAIGIIATVQDGLLHGLRFYWDAAPRVDVPYTASRTQSLKWSRAVLGWGFQTDGWGFLDDFEIVPRIGVLDYTADLTDDITSPKSFAISKSVTLGSEFGYRYETSLLMLRLWFGFDEGIAKLSRDGTMDSKRAGVDLFLDVPYLNMYSNIDFVAFTYADSFVISQNDKDGPELSIQKFSYMQQYAGLGLVYSW